MTDFRILFHFIFITFLEYFLILIFFLGDLSSPSHQGLLWQIKIFLLGSTLLYIFYDANKYKFTSQKIIINAEYQFCSEDGGEVLLEGIEHAVEPEDGGVVGGGVVEVEKYGGSR